MSRPEQASTRDGAQETEGDPPEIREEGGCAALRAPPGGPSAHVAELRHEANVFLDAVVVMVTDFLQDHGFALVAPVGARFRLAENGSSGVEVVVRLEDPGHANTAKAALVERFPDRLSEMIVS